MDKNTINNFILVFFFALAAHCLEKLQEIPYPFDPTLKPFVHNKQFLVVYDGPDNRPRYYDLLRKSESDEYALQSPAAHWDIFFNKQNAEVYFYKPNNEQRYLDLNRYDEKGERISVESSALSKDLFISYYYDGVVKAWDISKIEVEEVWSTQLKRAKYWFAEISLSLDEQQIIILTKQEERAQRQASICAVLDAKTGAIIFDSVNEFGNTDVVFSSQVPRRILLNSWLDSNRPVMLDLPTGALQPIDINSNINSLFSCQQARANKLFFVSNNGFTFYFVSSGNVSAFTSPGEIIFAGASPNRRNIFLLLGNGEDVHSLKFINISGNVGLTVPLHIPPNFSLLNLERHRYLSRVASMAPQFSDDDSLAFWGNSIIDVSNKKVIHTFDQLVEEGEFISLPTGEQFFISSQRLCPKGKASFKLHQLPLMIKKSSETFLGAWLGWTSLGP